MSENFNLPEPRHGGDPLPLRAPNAARRARRVIASPPEGEPAAQSSRGSLDVPTPVLARELLRREGDTLLRWALAEHAIQAHLADQGSELPERYVADVRERAFDAISDAERELIYSLPWLEDWEADCEAREADERLEDEAVG